jgi:hypothetical protein
MNLEEIHILPTNTTPEILLDPKGIIKIKGRAIDESRAKIPEQMAKWIDAYILNPAELTEIIIALEFLNSFNTLVLTATLKKFSQIIRDKKKLLIHWYYEEDDVDIFERGEYISSTINLPIEFTVTENIDGC